MNYQTAKDDLPDNTYMMLRKKFGEFTKDGRPNTPGVPPRDLKKITPVLSAKKMKTFKEFINDIKEGGFVYPLHKLKTLSTKQKMKGYDIIFDTSRGKGLTDRLSNFKKDTGGV